MWKSRKDKSGPSMKVSSRGGFTLVRIFQNATSYILTYSVCIYMNIDLYIYTIFF